MYFLYSLSPFLPLSLFFFPYFHVPITTLSILSPSKMTSSPPSFPSFLLFPLPRLPPFYMTSSLPSLPFLSQYYMTYNSPLASFFYFLPSPSLPFLPRFTPPQPAFPLSSLLPSPPNLSPSPLPPPSHPGPALSPGAYSCSSGRGACMRPNGLKCDYTEPRGFGGDFVRRNMTGKK